MKLSIALVFFGLLVLASANKRRQTSKLLNSRYGSSEQYNEDLPVQLVNQVRIVKPKLFSSQYGGSQYGQVQPPSVQQYGQVQPPPSVQQYGQVQPPSVKQYGQVQPPSVQQYGQVQPPSVQQYGQVKPSSVQQYGQVSLQYGQYSNQYDDRSAALGLSGNPCIGQPADLKLPHPMHSSKYVHCMEEENWEVIECPNLLVFLPSTQKCENTIRQPKGCLSDPCQNGGRCVDLPLFQFSCDCPSGFAGDFCDKSDACLVGPAITGATCITLPLGFLFSKYYICPGLSTYGPDCSSNFETNPCLSNDADYNRLFSSKFGPSFYVQCEGHIPHLKACADQTVFVSELQGCEWTTDDSGLGLESGSSAYGGSSSLGLVLNIKKVIRQNGY